MRRLIVLPVLLAALALGGGASADPPTLVGSVGPFFTIDLKDASGAAVTHLDPGTYTLVVHDLSSGHNFHLFGPGVDVATGVEFTGDTTFTVNLTDGSYTYQCDVHAGEMSGGFTVGSAQAPPTTTTSKPPPPPKAKPKKHDPKKKPKKMR
jgi:hypothetical protein